MERMMRRTHARTSSKNPFLRRHAVSRARTAALRSRSAPKEPTAPLRAPFLPFPKRESAARIRWYSTVPLSHGGFMRTWHSENGGARQSPSLRSGGARPGSAARLSLPAANRSSANRSWSHNALAAGGLYPSLCSSSRWAMSAPLSTSASAATSTTPRRLETNYGYGLRLQPSQCGSGLPA